MVIVDNQKNISYNGYVRKDGKGAVLMTKLLTSTVPMPARV